MTSSPFALIEPVALSFLLVQDDVVVLDGSYAIGSAGETPYASWQAARIGQARFFDIDAIADRDSLLPHMLPAPAQFAEAVAAMGISNKTRIVVYDQTGMAMAAARVWWMFRVFGHTNISVLNGGLPAWRAAGLPLTTTPPRPVETPGTFTATFRPELVRAKAEIQAALAQPEIAIIDARSAERFAGIAPEPRPGLRAGHIPGSMNYPFPSLLDPVSGRMQDEDTLQHALRDVATAPAIISTCGSGVTACVLALALHTLGRENVAVYDGSWTEWGDAAAGTPVAAGAAKV